MPSIAASGARLMNKMTNKLARILILIVVVAGIVLAIIYREDFNVSALQTWVKDAGPVGPLLFMLIYTLATVLFLPGSVLTIAGGALFGPVLGTFYNLTGATIGATLAFLVARYLSSDWVERKTGGRLKQLKEGVEGEGWRFVAFVRLVPLFPFNLLNYALGLTRIRLSHYIIASYLFMLPGAIAYTYLGYAGREAVAGGGGLVQKGLMALALLAIVAFLPRLIGRLRQKTMISIPELKQYLDQGEDILVLDVRSPADFVGEQGHIEKAMNIPLEELANRTEEIKTYEERPIYLVCRTDRRSSKAAHILASKGFANVQVVRGGMTDWNTNGFPIQH